MTKDDRLRKALLTHHPIMRSETSPLSGCRCGQVGLGEDIIAHVITKLRAALNPERSSTMPDCGHRLYVDVETLHCNRLAHHYPKPHRATGTWLTSNDDGLLTATVTWASSSTDWDDDEDDQ